MKIIDEREPPPKKKKKATTTTTTTTTKKQTNKQGNKNQIFLMFSFQVSIIKFSHFKHITNRPIQDFS